MALSRTFFAASAIFFLGYAHNAPLMGENARFEAVGIKRNTEGFGSEPLAADEYLAAMAPPARLGEKNITIPELKDRSLELVDRQSCAADSWYCPCMLAFILFYLKTRTLHPLRSTP